MISLTFFIALILFQPGPDGPVKVKALPELVVFENNGRREGVSAAFGGALEGAVVVAGGCNFPDKPAAEGGAKVYYDRIYVLRHPEASPTGWEMVGRLPQKAANGASITLPEGIVCIGGTNSEKPSNRVWLLKWNKEQSAILTQELPALPCAMDNLAAGTDGTNIYVAGGNIDGLPGNRAFVLNGINASGWKELPPFPGAARLQAVGAVLNNKFYLFGGFQPVIEGQECIVSTDGVCYDPVRNRWSSAAQMLPEGRTEALTSVGAAGVTVNNGTLLLTGGVNRSIFKAAVDNPLLQTRAADNGQTALCQRLKQEQADYMKHAPEWYNFNRQILVYHPATDTWTTLGNCPESARAGAVLIFYKGKLIHVNGETKPGIRSAGAYMIDV